MPSVSNSHFGAFLDAYNQGNTIPDTAADKFKVRTEADNKVIMSHLETQDDPDAMLLREKFKQITSVLNDSRPRGYEKLTATGNVLTSISSELTKSADPYIQKSGRNIIKSFLEAAQETRDQQLLMIAYHVGKAAL